MIDLINRSTSSPHTNMIANAEECIRSGTVTLCLDINARLAMRLENHSRDEKCSPDAMVNAILAGYFQEMDHPSGGISGRECRKHTRKTVSIPGVIEIQLGNNETQYKPVNIVNISLGGAGITMEGKTTRVLENINKQAPFLMIFNIPSLAEIISLPCKPRHVSMNSHTAIGVAFMNVPDETRSTLQSHFQL
ncbi:MAG: PilZ domain-containing protein [Thermodesulfobacteriota bacterium]